MTMRERAAGMDRRTFLGAAAGAAGGAVGVAAAGSSRRVVRNTRARNVVLLVSDGCSTGTIAIADEARRRHPAWIMGCGVPTDHGPGHWSGLWGRDGVRRAMQRTAAANSLVTDSAAASTAWSIGRKADNGAVCVTPDGAEHEPMLVDARRRGWATGLVTTTAITHATPAGFIATVSQRWEEEPIAQQIVERGLDVGLGGGASRFDAELLERSGARVVRTEGELAREDDPGRDVLGLFAPGHMAYEIDRPESEPTLWQMSERALAMLEARAAGREGFVLMIEGGRVDHAAHANDAAALVADQLAFDEAVGVVTAWAAERDDTLVIVTSDHGNANPGLTLYYDEAVDGLGAIANARHSFEWLAGRYAEEGDGLDGARARALAEEMAGVGIADDAWEIVERALFERGLGDAFVARRSWMHALGSALGNATAVGFVSGNHTADYTELTAFGLGSERVGGMMENTEVCGVVRRALGWG